MRSEFLALCDEVDLPKDMQEYDKETGRFKYRTASVMWLGFSKAWEKRQTEVDELQLKLSEDSRILHNVIDIERKKNEELQKRVQELTVGCGLQRDHIKGLEAELKKAWTTVDQEGHKNHELLMLLKFVKEHFEMNDLDKAMPRVYEELEQALKGDSTVNSTMGERGECLHFSTTLFNDGKAECFHCDAVVNEKREVIGKQSKCLHPFFKKESK